MLGDDTADAIVEKAKELTIGLAKDFAAGKVAKTDLGKERDARVKALLPEASAARPKVVAKRKHPEKAEDEKEDEEEEKEGEAEILQKTASAGHEKQGAEAKMGKKHKSEEKEAAESKVLKKPASAGKRGKSGPTKERSSADDEGLVGRGPKGDNNNERGGTGIESGMVG